ncbi:MAG: SH3 domain-containing protein [Campylobacter sp.]|nr:SH3 domain-containing protein [Campylobacter sp.]
MLKFALIFLLPFTLLATDLNEASVFDMMERSAEDKLINKPKPNPQIHNKSALPKQKISPEELKNIVPTDEPDLNIPDSQVYDTIVTKELILKAVKVPKSVFVGEIFQVSIEADTQSEFDFKFTTNIDENDIKLLNPNGVEWINQGDSKYLGTLFLQAKNTKVKHLKLELSISRNDQTYQKSNLNVYLPRFKEIRSRTDFNHIVANELEVKKFKTSKFDENSLIMIVELAGKNIDIASFHLDDKTILKQGVDTIVGDFSSQSAYYFAVFKPNKTTLDFSYYNLEKQKFESFSLPVSVEEDDVSTQIGLNPKQSEFSTYKNVILYTLSALFLVLTFIRKRFSYLIATVLCIAASIYAYNPFSKGILKANVNVKILPTTKSTIFYTSKQNENIEILNEKNDYVKILFDDDKIGWVKKDDIIKN